MGTPKELHFRETPHRSPWHNLRETGRRVEVVVVAWELHLLDRAEWVLTSCQGRAISDAEQEAVMIRHAIANTDLDTVERHGGFDAARWASTFSTGCGGLTWRRSFNAQRLSLRGRSPPGCGGGCRLAKPASSLESAPSGARARLTGARTTAPWPDFRRAGSRHANPVAEMDRADGYGKCRPRWKPAPTAPGFPQPRRRVD